MTAYGLDIGSHSINAVKLKRTGKGTVKLLGAFSTPVDSIGDEGTDRSRALAIQRELKVAGWSLGGTWMGVSGRDSIIRYTHMPVVPGWRLKLVMKYEIQEIGDKAGEKISGDYRILNVPRAGMDRLTLLVGMAKEDEVTGLIDSLEETGITLRGLLPSPLALYNAHRGLGTMDHTQTTLLLDIGHENMDLAIQMEGFLIFARSIPNGASAWTERIARALELSEEEAEALKAEPRDQEEEVRKALRPAFNQLRRLIEQSLQFCRSQVKLAEAIQLDEIRLSGGGAKVAGLCRHLADGLEVPVSVTDPMDVLDLSAVPAADRAYLTGRGPELMVALGLALTEELDGAFDLDLLPTEYKERRDFRERTIYLFAAAACVLLFLLAGFFHAYSYRGERADRKETLANQVSTLEGWSADHSDLKTRNREFRSGLNTLSERTLPGYHSLRLLDRMSAWVPSRLTIQRLAYQPPNPEEPEPEEGTRFRIEGEIDNADGGGNRVLAQFRETLLADGEISEVDVLTTRDKASGTFLEFTLSVLCR